MAQHANWNRRHFEETAEVIRTLRTRIGPFERDRVAIEFADKFEKANPGFDRTRFLKACGMPVAEPGETPGDDE